MSRRVSTRGRWLGLAASVGAALPAVGCAPDFIPQSEITKPRIFTAKIVIDGDTENRARPKPGETFTIHYYLMSPGRPQTSYTAMGALCAGTTLTDGTLICADELPLDTIMLAPYEGNDELVLTGLFVPDLSDLVPGELPDDLPDGFTLEDVSSVALFGSMCVEGQIERVEGSNIAKDPVPHLFQCTDNDDSPFPQQLPFSMSVRLDLGGTGQLNHHPSFACDEEDQNSPCTHGVEHELSDDLTVTTPGPIILAYPEEEAEPDQRERVWEPWDPALELPWDNCAESEAMPKVYADTKEHTFYVRVDASDREPYEREIRSNDGTVVEETREEIVVSHASQTKGGKVDSYSSVVRDDEPDDTAEIEVDYTPPRQSDDPDKHIPDAGKLVRFYFALRDQRGGVDFTTRELCVLPPKD